MRPFALDWTIDSGFAHAGIDTLFVLVKDQAVLMLGQIITSPVGQGCVYIVGYLYLQV